jgi:hypothetical protein
VGRPTKQKQQLDAEQKPAPPAGEAAKSAGEIPASKPSASIGTGEPADRIDVRLDAGGHIMPMREENREKLRRALEASPDFFGGDYKPQLTKFVDEALAGRMLDAVTAVQSFAFSKTAKVPYDKAAEVLRFDSEEKKNLAPSACVLLNQYGGAWLSRHGALLEFGVKFAAIEASKFDKAIALAREHQRTAPAVAKQEGAS